MPRDHSREQPQWLLARHSALTARQLLRAYGLLCLFSLVIAAAFALRGLWTIPVFSFAELGLVAAALLHYLRHARDYEHIALRDGELIVEQVSAGRCRRHHFSPWRTRVEVPQGSRQLIHINDMCDATRHVAVGVFATPERRRQVAQELGALLPPYLGP
ncbi:hypothetical protein JAB5_53540 [Janthinobacterium sp. HH103]|uniref:DUF2244 domain-containing protein n=1 Tax=unclassified Janthinobacterium TaxID=2610881 RepID=UPI000875509C|nr:MULTISPECIES: DUF2244 domain-containing protein [unclassified Janthinobacterium]OEZ67752.1 hypothetical protein JAB5_53540 [Janthinobacterium sp. HH103]OEZ69100.1 hypothetical protein JAB2_15390 [Janthinobacterium sp. HH100]QOU72290.1 hypothetical protein JAB4_017150 [Janthinobacterium sp. HH102]